ncbi:hypothetical protein E4U21_007182 [Claviceps maximensis]|nr:hypothetical protein E4U21_007182 [Claviceps maximensis]
MLRTMTGATALLALISGTTALATPKVQLTHSVQSVWPTGYFSCLFFDDFSGPSGSLPDERRWQIDLGTRYDGGPKHWGTGEIQVYTNETKNLEITKDQTLRITPVLSRNGSWTSARIETKPEWDFSCPPGHRMRVEAKIRLGANPTQNSLGIWPAFWAMGGKFRGHYASWPSVGEIDIMESVNGLDKVWHTIHCDKYPGGVCKEPTGVTHESPGIHRGHWHTIAWEVDRHHAAGQGKQSMSWIIDGRTRFTIHESNLTSPGNSSAADAWRALTSNKMMILLNVAVGGAFPNGVFNSDGVSKIDTPTNMTRGGHGASMEVDYVAVFSTKK